MRRSASSPPRRPHVRTAFSGLVGFAAVAALGVSAADLSTGESLHPRMSEGFVRQAGAFSAQHVGLGSATGPLHVAALGDSVPAGYGSSSYVNTVGRTLGQQQRRSVDIDNEAVDGLGSADVADALRQPSSASSQAVANADVTIIEVGANDFDASSASDTSCAPVTTSGCYSDDMASMKKNVQSIVDDVKKREKRGGRIVVVGYWNDFKDGQVGESEGADYVAQGRALARWTNSTLKSIAVADGVAYADVYTPFFAGGKDVTSELQGDGDHPNASGHQIIADAVLQALGTPTQA